MHANASPTRLPRADRGFTLLELLVVIGVIGLLLAIVFATGSAVLRTAHNTTTERLLGAIGQGLEQFKADHGYYPPLLNENYENGAWSGQDRLVVANEPGDTISPYNPYFAGPALLDEPNRDLMADDTSGFNVYSLAIYLQGVGDLNGDGDEIYDDPATTVVEHNLDDGLDGPGLRSPGSDRSWGGARDRTDYVAGGPHRPPAEGRVFGPYVAVESGRNFERIPDNDTVNDTDRRYAGLYRFVDRWGNPIRYYRDWTLRDGGARTMVKVPFEIRDGREAKDFLDGAYGPSFDEAMERIDRDLAGAPYVLLSIGRDGRSGHRTVNELRGFFSGGGDPDERNELIEEVMDNVRYTP